MNLLPCIINQPIQTFSLELFKFSNTQLIIFKMFVFAVIQALSFPVTENLNYSKNFNLSLKKENFSFNNICISL